MTMQLSTVNSAQSTFQSSLAQTPKGVSPNTESYASIAKSIFTTSSARLSLATKAIVVLTVAASLQVVASTGTDQSHLENRSYTLAQHIYGLIFGGCVGVGIILSHGDSITPVDLR